MNMHGSKPPIFQYSSYSEYLKDFAHYQKTKNRNWSYSIWTKKLNLKSKSTLTMILNGSRHPSSKLLEKFNSVLGLNPDEWLYFKRLVSIQKIKNKQIAELEMLAKNEIKSTAANRVWLQLVILDLCELNGFIQDADWISQHLLLNISTTEIKEAWDSLIANKFVSEVSRGIFKRQPADLSSLMGQITDSELIQFHQDCSNASQESLIRSPKSDRKFLTSVLKISKSKLPEAELILKETQKKLSQLLENQNADSVYELHLHLFPVTKTGLTEFNS